ncbi:MAG: DUF58 domain-containing protein, partial [Nitriliruptoraceae bacterium]
RVVVGEQAVARVSARSGNRRRASGGRIEVPVGVGTAVFDVPTITEQATWEDSFIVPTNRRAVITVGPARAVTADPLGAAQRDIVSGSQTELYVHPLTVNLPSLSSGWMRDLEGQTTNDLSPSDVAFHTLREYVPGDDRRHIHWRSSAKIGTLMVRQFVDTRRSQIGLALPLSPDVWDDEDTFELGVQVIGSLGRTAILDGQAVQAVAGRRTLAVHTGQRLLDELAAVDPDETEPGLEDFVRSAAAALDGSSITVIATGEAADHAELRRQCERFGHSTKVVTVTVAPGQEPQRRTVGRVTMLTVGDLDGLVRLLNVGVLA